VNLRPAATKDLVAREYGSATEVVVKKWFAYAYHVKGDPAEIREVVPQHVAYWKALNPDGYRGGPFSDRTGGLITFTEIGYI